MRDERAEGKGPQEFGRTGSTGKSPEPGKDKGTYVLVLALRCAAWIRVGSLGGIFFSPGYYVYAGSAQGPGGLGARLGHHLREAARPRWHIDYLRTAARPERFWFLKAPANREHAWANLLGSMPGAAIPVRRFGASDCLCATHLFHFKKRPCLGRFRRLVGERFPADGPAQAIVLSRGG